MIMIQGQSQNVLHKYFVLSSYTVFDAQGQLDLILLYCVDDWFITKVNTRETLKAPFHVKKKTFSFAGKPLMS